MLLNSRPPIEFLRFDYGGGLLGSTGLSALGFTFLAGALLAGFVAVFSGVVRRSLGASSVSGGLAIATPATGIANFCSSL